jgi:hypothetical protein
MKNIIISTILTAVCTICFAQTNPRETGPKAKNQKIWERDQNFNGVHGETNQTSTIKGPKAKNQKHIYRPETLTLNLTTERTLVKGPKAKNQKIWKD